MFIIQSHCPTLQEYDLFIEEHKIGEPIVDIYPRIMFQTKLTKEDLPNIPMRKDSQPHIVGSIEYNLNENNEITGLFIIRIEDEVDQCIVSGSYDDWSHFIQRKQNCATAI